MLQENVLRFVNLIGHVVHSNTMHYKGSPNKNIGDAFLLVWKVKSRGGKALKVDMPQTTDDLFPGFTSTKDAAEASTMADGALKARGGRERRTPSSQARGEHLSLGRGGDTTQHDL